MVRRIIGFSVIAVAVAVAGVHRSASFQGTWRWQPHFHVQSIQLLQKQKQKHHCSPSQTPRGVLSSACSRTCSRQCQPLFLGAVYVSNSTKGACNRSDAECTTSSLTSLKHATPSPTSALTTGRSFQPESHHHHHHHRSSAVSFDNNYNFIHNGEDGIRRRALLQSFAAVAATISIGPAFMLVLPQRVLASTLETINNIEIQNNSSSHIDINKMPLGAVIKPPLDDRDYLAYTLESNGVRVLLVSDPGSLEAAAAMNVHVGATSDPDTIAGLAHFCEHMLFLGTKLYPKEDSFEAFLSSNGGSSNAYTDSENTLYYMTMEVESDVKFGEALRRFGSFFACPLFSESATGRELNAIESENAKNLQSDTFRFFQLTKARANPNHPFSKFFTGNKMTLLDQPKAAGINLRQELLNFYNLYYSSNQMTLAVIGPQSIDSLQKLVSDNFGDIPRKSTPRPEENWSGIAPFGDAVHEQNVVPPFRHVLEIVPVQDLRQVTLTWPLLYGSNNNKNAFNRTTSLLVKPSSYVGHLLGHEGPKSLLSYLKEKGWANSVAAGNEDNLSDFELFEVVVGLTPQGLNSIDDVIASVFSYLYLLRDQIIPVNIIEEVLQLEELQWRYSTKDGVGNFAQSLASSMQKYPAELYVAGPRRLALDEYDSGNLSGDARMKFVSHEALDRTRDHVQRFVNGLSVDNVMISVLSKTVEGQTDTKEKWYGTDYRVRSVPVSTLDKWRKGLKESSMKIDFPRPNPFIPSEIGLIVKHPPPVTNKRDAAEARSFESRMTPPEPPRVIRTDDRWMVHFREDDRFGQPKGYLIFQLLNNEVYASPVRVALSYLYEICILDRLREYAYDAELVGLTYDVKVVPRGVRLTFGGYTSKLKDFSSYIARKLSVDVKGILPSKDADFDRYKDQVLRSLSGFDVQQPYSHASYYAQLTLQPLHFQYSNAELRVAMRKITLPDLVEYAKTIWSTAGKGEALVQGNFYTDEALDLVSTIGDVLLPFRRSSFSSRSDNNNADKFVPPPYLRALPLPVGDANVLPTRLMVLEPNQSNENSCSYILLQSLGETPKDHVLMELLGAILSEPFYNELRTQKQLGYIVSSGVRGVGESRTLSFVVQSNVKESDELTINILAYLESVEDQILNKLRASDLAVYVKSLIDRKTEPDKDLVSEVTRNWGEIASGRLQFDRIQQEAAALLELTRADVLAYWKTLYAGDGRRVLISEIIPRSGRASSSALPPSSFGYKLMDLADEGITLGIDDIEMFRRDREQMVEQYIEV